MNSILVIGKPNSGKSLLFNRLTGLNQKVANYPGVTVEVKKGTFQNFTLIDLPGVYSFNPITEDERIAISKFDDELKKASSRAVLCLIDATRLEQSLVVGLQAQKKAFEMNKPFIFVVNMIDEIISSGTKIDLEEIEKNVHAPVLGISAKTKLGLDKLEAKIHSVTIGEFTPPKLSASWDNLASIQSFSKTLSKKYGPNSDVILKSQNRLDHLFLSNIFGGIIFTLIMAFLFQSIFTWASPAMDFVEYVISSLGEFTAAYITNPIFADFMKDAIFGGFGSFLVFVPQIFILSLIIGVLEDSGYLARAAIICHKPLSYFGLSGKSFIPLLTGHACAIPAILAARNIESPKKRFLTILAVPFVACSARLPVYAVLISALIPPLTFYGIIGLQGMTFFAMYTFGIFMALIVSALISKFKFSKFKEDSPFIIELPNYRIPNFRFQFRKASQSSLAFITKAGAIIFFLNMIIWFLGYFPSGSGHLDESYLAILGKWIEPLVRPLDLDWKYGLAILTSFLAREVFVGTLGTLFGIEEATDNVQGLATYIQNSGMTLASGLALLVFYAVAIQCASTLAIIKKETGSYKVPVMVFISYTLLAYVLALITFNIVTIF